MSSVPHPGVDPDRTSGRAPLGHPPPTHLRRGRATVATLLAGALVCLGVLADGASAQEHGGPETVLAAAREARHSAEAELVLRRADHDRLVADLERLATGAQQITAELAEARREVREYAVAAFIDAGQAALLTAMLSPGDAAALAWRSNLVGGQVVATDEAVDRLAVLEDSNEPARVAAAAELDRARAALGAAEEALVLAVAAERDAEAALAAHRAEVRAAEARAAEAAAAQGDGTATPRVAARTEAEAADPAPPSAGTGSAGPADATPDELATLARIRHCESRGDYTVVSSTGRYRGAYQFDTRTWQGVGGTGDPAAASPAEQDSRALILLRRRGTAPWPNCG